MVNWGDNTVKELLALRVTVDVNQHFSGTVNVAEKVDAT